MKYTTDRPTVTGYYWVKMIGRKVKNPYQTVLHVDSSGQYRATPSPKWVSDYPSAGAMSRTTVCLDGKYYPVIDGRFLAFAGPIPFPEE
jgi:hypothetical protein